MKNKSYRSRTQFSDSPNIPKFALYIDSSPSSNSILNIITSLLSFTNVSVEKLTIVLLDSIAKSYTLSLGKES